MSSSRFLIRSIDRNKTAYPSASDFLINLGDVVDKVTLIKSVNITIPMSIYNITKNNRCWEFKYGNDAYRKFYINNGKYDIDDIIKEIKDIVNDGYGFIIIDTKFKDKIGKMSIQWNKVDVETKVHFNFNVPNSIADVLGYDHIEYILQTDGFWLDAPRMFDPTGGVRLIYLLVDFLDTTNSLISTDEDLNTDLFIALPIQWNLDITYYGSQDLINNSVEFIKPKMIQSIHFKLMVYYNGRPSFVDLNGHDWFIELFFDTPLMN